WTVAAVAVQIGNGFRPRTDYSLNFDTGAMEIIRHLPAVPEGVYHAHVDWGIVRVGKFGEGGLISRKQVFVIGVSVSEEQAIVKISSEDGGFVVKPVAQGFIG